VTITDADRGIEIAGGGYNTVTQVTLSTKWRKTPNLLGAYTTGHYGFSMNSRTQDNLVTESELQTVFDHNLAVQNFANGNVYAGLLAQSGRLDHHGGAPYENLYTEIVLQRGGDLFKSGGNRRNEPNSGARATFWNIVVLNNTFPSSYNTFKFPQLNVIGIDKWATKQTTTQEWIERWPGALTSPPNLYEAQLQHRKGSVQLWIAAEAGESLKQPMVVGTDSRALGEKYIWVPEGAGNIWDPASTGGEILYRFTVPVAGIYAVWGRVLVSGGDSFYVWMDSSQPLLWTTRHGEGAWVWDQVHERNAAPARFTLTAGTHTFRLKQREDGTKLDHLLITNDLSYTPN
jgi:hypothetical protein